MNKDKIPPQNVEAEQSVLGGILLDNEAIYNVLEILAEEDFYKENHAVIFQAMRRLVEKNEPVDIITLTEQLKKENRIDNIGGASYIAHLSDIVPTAANISYYSKIVKQKAILRKLITTATHIVSKGYEAEGDAEGLINDAEKAIYDISKRDIRGSFTSMKDVITGSFKKIEYLYEKKASITGIPSNFADVDKLTAGFQPSDLIIIAARPSMGKTALALNMASNAAVFAKASVAVFSLEMSKEQLGLRMLCSEAKIDSQKLRTGFLEKEDWPKLAKSAGVLADANIFIDDTAGISVSEIRAKSRRLKRDTGLDLLIIDYLQLVTTRGRIESREQEIAGISRELKALAKDLSIPVIALSQLNRAVEMREDKRPRMADLRESGAIEQDADVVAFIYRDEIYNPDTTKDPGIAEIIVAKQRNGPTGKARLTFLNEYTRFENYADED